MTRVDIEAGGRHIVIDQPGGELCAVADQAWNLWATTSESENLTPPGPALGFVAERRGSTSYTPLNTDMREPTAELR